MNRMERIGWWFLRHSKPQKHYLFICPNCNTVNPSVVKKCMKCGLKVIYKTEIETDKDLIFMDSNNNEL